MNTVETLECNRDPCRCEVDTFHEKVTAGQTNGALGYESDSYFSKRLCTHTYIWDGGTRSQRHSIYLRIFFNARQRLVHVSIRSVTEKEIARAYLLFPLASDS